MHPRGAPRELPSHVLRPQCAPDDLTPQSLRALGSADILPLQTSRSGGSDGILPLQTLRCDGATVFCRSRTRGAPTPAVFFSSTQQCRRASMRICGCVARPYTLTAAPGIASASENTSNPQFREPIPARRSVSRRCEISLPNPHSADIRPAQFVAGWSLGAQVVGALHTASNGSLEYKRRLSMRPSAGAPAASDRTRDEHAT